MPACATGYAFQAIYMYPVGTPNNHATKLVGMRNMVTNLNGFFYDESKRSGYPAGRDLKFVCTSGLAPQVSVLSVEGPVNGYPWADFKVWMANNGFNAANRKYLIFCECTSSSFGGRSTMQHDSTKSTTNPNNTGPSYSIDYGPSWSAGTALHEISHAMGAVQADAPDHAGVGTSYAGHSDDERDVMAYTNSAGVPMRSVCTTQEWYDCDFDSYFDASTEEGEYLRSHWNIGWGGNYWIK